LLLFQFEDDAGTLRCAASDGGEQAAVLSTPGGTYALALDCLEQKRTLLDVVRERITDETIDKAAFADSGRFLPPLVHPEPARCIVSGTGLTHLGSADARDAMHKAGQAAGATDSLRMFAMGVERGRPTDGRPGVQPEWFFKGDGECIVRPGAPLPLPDFAGDGGEEPELVGLYVIDGEGVPRRLGFALGNEFSDHVVERENYLWLAHSKLRKCSLGPALRIGDLPDEVSGTVRIRRDSEILWEKSFATGQANMSHAIENLEYHHFKYPGFRRPGDVHVHFLGTATLSFADDVRTQTGDVFEIEVPGFGPALVNPLVTEAASFPYAGVRAL
jgi:hypothetical protein